jgi:hypothetical protein
VSQIPWIKLVLQKTGVTGERKGICHNVEHRIANILRIAGHKEEMGRGVVE